MSGVLKEEELSQCLAVIQALCDESSNGWERHPLKDAVVQAARELIQHSKQRMKEEQLQRTRDNNALSASDLSNLIEQFREQKSEVGCYQEVAAKDETTKNCYVCKRAFLKSHRSYDQLCVPCGAFNFEKRMQSTDMSGFTAVVTGGRIKIGFEVALKLLRAGANVLITTRFPKDAGIRFSKQADFADWNERLKVYSLDLRNSPAIIEFTDFVKSNFPAVDILVNNAAQTISRPDAFYQPWLQNELRLASSPVEIVSGITVTPSSRLSPVAAREMLDSMVDYFPPGKFDEHGQQIDLRPHNTWVSAIEEVEPRELFEVTLVNSIAPFLLINQLIPNLEQSDRSAAFIINVSAVEGQFHVDWKRPHHPHTNMAKAALNMITRTCAESLAARKIYMNSVDTGWITNEFPHPQSEKMSEEGWVRPLDEIDGASRILDPVFQGVGGGVFLYGKFLKDYKIAPW